MLKECEDRVQGTGYRGQQIGFWLLALSLLALSRVVRMGLECERKVPPSLRFANIPRDHEISESHILFTVFSHCEYVVSIFRPYSFRLHLKKNCKEEKCIAA